MKTTKIIAFGIAAAIAAVSSSAMAFDADKDKRFKKCKGCHSVEPGKHKMGPSLAGVIGRKAGTAEGFTKYKAFKGADFVWDEETIAAWITNTKDFIKERGLKKSAMNVKVKKEKDREKIIAFLNEHK